MARVATIISAATLETTRSAAEEEMMSSMAGPEMISWIGMEIPESVPIRCMVGLAMTNT